MEMYRNITKYVKAQLILVNFCYNLSLIAFFVTQQYMHNHKGNQRCVNT